MDVTGSPGAVSIIGEQDASWLFQLFSNKVVALTAEAPEASNAVDVKVAGASRIRLLRGVRNVLRV